MGNKAFNLIVCDSSKVWFPRMRARLRANIPRVYNELMGFASSFPSLPPLILLPVAIVTGLPRDN